MRPFHLGVAVLLLAAVVIAVWLGLRDSSGVAFAGASGLRRSGASSGGISAAEDGTGNGDDPASSKARVALAPVAVAPIEAAAAPKTWDRPRLSGRVVDPEGTGIPGARVFAATGSAWISIPLDIEPDALPRAWIRVERTETDAEGTFVLDTLRPGDLRVAARAKGFAPRYVERLELVDAAECRLGDIRMERGVVLEGRVVEADGKGVGGAELLAALDATSPAAGTGISLPGHGIPLATTADDGSFRIDELSAGPWRLLVDAPGHAIAEQEGRTERAGERVSGLVFRLERGFEILGRVLFEEGAPKPAELRVAARPSPDRESDPVGPPAGEEPVPDASDVRARTAVCQADGTFVVRGVRADLRYQISVSERTDEPAEWKRSRATEPVYAFAGQRGVELQFRPASALLFRVLDGATGAPLTTCTVLAGIEDGEILRDSHDEAVRAFPEGRVRFGDLRPRRGSSDVVLRVAAPGFKDLVRTGIALGPGQELDLGDLRLDPERVVLARVVDGATGAPVAGARVLLGEGPDEDILARFGTTPDTDYFDDTEVRFARTEASGVARLSSLPGRTIVARADGRGFLVSDPVRAVLPDDRDAEIELRLKHGGLVEVRVTDAAGKAVAGVPIDHRRPGAEEDGGEDAPRKTEADGTLRYEALVPGAHAFRLGEGFSPYAEEDAAGAAAGWIETVASEGSRTTVEFRAPSRGGLSGSVREGGRPLASARLHLAEIRAEDEEEPAWFEPGTSDPFTTSTDHDGGYAFEGLRCARYRLFVSHGARRMPAVFEVDVANPARTFDVDLDVASLEGRASAADGSPIPNVRILASSMAGDGDTAESYRMILLEDDRGQPRIDYRPEGLVGTVTDANGRYVLRGVRSGEALVVEASGDFVLPATVEDQVLGPDEARRGVDFVLEPAGVLEVSLTGAPTPGRRDLRRFVRAMHAAREGEDEDDSSVHSGYIRGRTRTCRLRSLEPGAYRVTLGAEGDKEGVNVLSQDVEIVGGQVTRIAFPAR